ncbi:Endonuclease/exonuclease/phosphatase [Coniella lustricola]|uniref:Endonuclease/exonuclease/phosphatase n=1 Tax=Coniella lustricola TaxID=2025994 RepID=A0A2T3AEE5_9PEZI|nr:Endonuclease/exonuclease/phosphatase [Coniella lustricola]
MAASSTALPASLDVFILTFNSGKGLTDAPTFAAHLRGALAQRSKQNGSSSRKTSGGSEDLVNESENNANEDEEGGLSTLPDLVVFSLQEIAPLAYGYLGGHFLAPYLNPFEKALNMAAIDLLEQQQQQQQQQTPERHASASPSPSRLDIGETSGRPTGRRQPLHRSRSALSNIFRKQTDCPYKLMEMRNVGMTAIMLFARRPEAIVRIESAECAFGIANMGNKGAIALRVSYNSAGEEATVEQRSQLDNVVEITFVATHLAAMEYNLRRRNANWASICSSCLFEDPKKMIPARYHFDEPGAKNIIEASTHSSSTASNAKQTDGGRDIPTETEEEREALLARQLNDASMPSEFADYLHNISIFKPGSHVFVAGDLNYRISTTTPPSTAEFPNLDTYPEFLDRDQMRHEMEAQRTLHGLVEAPVEFPPTYKVKHLNQEKVAEAINKEEVQRAKEEGRGDEVVPWKWASHRWPGWCDRVLYLDIPGWVRERYANNSEAGSSASVTPEIKVHAYNSLPIMRTSDHRPVFFRATVPLLSRRELLPKISQVENLSSRDAQDPRIKLPVPIDTGAFARRATARKREVWTGMTALFFSTREGAIVVAALVAFGWWGWWVLKGGF